MRLSQFLNNSFAFSNHALITWKVIFRSELILLLLSELGRVLDERTHLRFDVSSSDVELLARVLRFGAFHHLWQMKLKCCNAARELLLDVFHGLLVNDELVCKRQLFIRLLAASIPD